MYLYLNAYILRAGRCKEEYEEIGVWMELKRLNKSKQGSSSKDNHYTKEEMRTIRKEIRKLLKKEMPRKPHKVCHNL